MHLAASSRVAACTRSLDQPSYNPLRIVFDILGEEMPVGTYSGLGYWTPQGYWRFPVGSDREEVGGFRKTLREHATDPELAIKQWEDERKQWAREREQSAKRLENAVTMTAHTTGRKWAALVQA